MAPVQPVLASVGGFSLEGVSLPIVNGWMNELRVMRYGYSRQWKTPAEVETTRIGDCKGKAITLYERLQLNGATNVRFVIGKHRAGDWFTHAWVEWETAKGSYILDPTFSGTAAPLRERSSGKYIPLYAYEGALKYRAMNTTLVAERPLRAVASGRSK
jgi:predicted transglutaminase-like cysteine proteinase